MMEEKKKGIQGRENGVGGHSMGTSWKRTWKSWNLTIFGQIHNN